MKLNKTQRFMRINVLLHEILDEGNFSRKELEDELANILYYSQLPTDKQLKTLKEWKKIHKKNYQKNYQH